MAVFLRLMLLFGIACLLVFAVLKAKHGAVPAHINAPRVPVASQPLTKSLLIQDGQPAAVPVKNTKPARSVGGGAVPAPLENAMPLQRIGALAQPTPPLSPMVMKATKSDPVKRWRLVFNAVATSAGGFDMNGQAFVLPEIDVLPAHEKCQTSVGARWPCGMVARTMLRGFINGKALTCKLPDVSVAITGVVECRLRNQDIAAWLVQNGWARAKFGGVLSNDQRSAEQARRGIFGAPPPNTTPNEP